MDFRESYADIRDYNMNILIASRILVIQAIFIMNIRITVTLFVIVSNIFVSLIFQYLYSCPYHEHFAYGLVYS